MSKAHYIIPIFVPHEGCPHNCVFCNQNTITGNKEIVDKISVKNKIEKYLETIDNDSAIVEVSFFGGTFTAIPMEKQNELLEVAKRFKDGGRVNFIRMSTRPDYINADILENLKMYDADIIELGIQSLDEEVLKRSGRGHDENDVVRASKLIKDYGFTLGHQIMLGLPGDSIEKDIETAKKVVSMNPDICRIYPSLVIKDTPMEQMYKNGSYIPYTLEEAVNISKVIYGILSSNKINVIRIGLQPTEEINVGGELIAGPFHPSFRELVEGSLYKDLILDTIGKGNGDFTISINNKDISKLYADKKYFFNDMKKQLSTININVIQDDLIKRGELVIEVDGKCKKVSLEEYVNRIYKEGDY